MSENLPYAHTEEEHAAHRRSQRRVLIAGAAIAAIILAPHLLPHFGIGALAQSSAMTACAPTGISTGFAGAVSNMLSYVPMIGGELAKGGWMNSLVSAGIGIGGSLLGSYLDKDADGTTHFKWGKLLRNVALATSLLVAVPALFPAVNMGLMYLATLTMPTIASQINGVLLHTLGTVGHSVGAIKELGTGLSLSSALLPHLAACGLSFGSTAAVIGQNGAANVAADVGTMSFAERELQRSSEPGMQKGMR